MKELKVKEIENLKGEKVAIGYCDLQFLLNEYRSDKVEKLGFYANHLGWRADVYRVTSKSGEILNIITGYASPRCFKKSLEYDFLAKYDDEAFEISKKFWIENHAKAKEEFDELIERFMKEYRNYIK